MPATKEAPVGIHSDVEAARGRGFSDPSSWESVWEDSLEQREDFEELVTEILLALDRFTDLRDGHDVDAARAAVMGELLRYDCRGAVAERERDGLRALLKQAHDRDKFLGDMPPIKWYDDVARYFKGQP